MSSRRRRSSGPPPPLPVYVYQDDYFQPSYSNATSSLHSNGTHNSQHGPPLAYPSLDSHHQRGSLPIDHAEPSRGRRLSRQPAYLDLRWNDREPELPPYDYEDLSRSRRPPRSHSHSHSHGYSNPSHGRDGPRGRPPSSRNGRGPSVSSSSSRSKSMSCTKDRRKEDAGTPWWQNPLIRTCAITALSTGISAALDSRGDPGQWRGAKGAKVAVATVGSALVDGFLGQRHPEGLRHNVMRKGMEVAMDEAERRKHQGEDMVEEEVDKHARHHSRHHSGDRRGYRSRERSHGRRH